MKHKYFIQSDPQKSYVEFYANIPFRFREVLAEDLYSKIPEWLLDFPINVLYTSCYSQTPDIAGPAVGSPPKLMNFYERACYTADISTCRVSQTMMMMVYRPACESDYYVRVDIDRTTKCMWVRKFQGERLVAEASGTNYYRTMIQATCLGVLDDEPRTSEPHFH